MIQVLFGASTAAVVASTSYHPLHGGITFTGTESTARSPWSVPGVLRHLVVELSAAPGAGTARTLTLRKNGAGTALTVTISDSATTARLTGVEVTVAAGDFVALQHTVTGSPAAAFLRWSLECEGSTAQQSGYTGTTGTLASANGTRGCGVFNFGSQNAATAADIRQTVGAAGTLVRTDFSAGTAPNASTGFTAYVNLNGVRQDGTGGTVDTACALIGAIQASRTYSLPLAAGDLVYLELVPTGTVSVRPFQVGTAFTATTDGESQLCGSTITQSLSPTTTTYINAALTGASPGSTEPGFPVSLLPGVTSVRLAGLRVLCSAAPGVGKSRLVDLRVAAASPGPTVTISDSATTASDLTHTATIVDGADRWNLRSVPTGTPATMVLHWSLIQGPASAAADAERADTFLWVPV